MIYYKNSSELYHHGILGQKWGVRRYQNKDGTLTEAGKKRYDTVAKNAPSGKPKKELTSEEKKARNKKLLIAGASVTAAALAVYGGYKYSDFVKRTASDKIIEEGKRVADLSLSQVASAETDFLAQTYREIAEDMLKSSSRNAYEVSSSFKESYKYLHGKK